MRGKAGNHDGEKFNNLLRKAEAEGFHIWDYLADHETLFSLAIHYKHHKVYKILTNSDNLEKITKNNKLDILINSIEKGFKDFRDRTPILEEILRKIRFLKYLDDKQIEKLKSQDFVNFLEQNRNGLSPISYLIKEEKNNESQQLLAKLLLLPLKLNIQSQISSTDNEDGLFPLDYAISRCVENDKKDALEKLLDYCEKNKLPKYSSIFIKYINFVQDDRPNIQKFWKSLDAFPSLVNVESNIGQPLIFSVLYEGALAKEDQSLDKKVSVLKTEKASLEEQIKFVEEQIQSARGNQETSIEVNKGALKTHENHNSQLDKIYKDLKKEKNVLEKKIGNYQNKIQNTKKTLNSNNSSMKEIKAQMEEKSQQCFELQQQILKIETEKKKLAEKLNQLESANSNIEEECSRFHNELGHSISKKEKLQKEIDSQVIKIANKQREIKSLQENIQSEENKNYQQIEKKTTECSVLKAKLAAIDEEIKKWLQLPEKSQTKHSILISNEKDIIKESKMEISDTEEDEGGFRQKHKSVGDDFLSSSKRRRADQNDDKDSNRENSEREETEVEVTQQPKVSQTSVMPIIFGRRYNGGFWEPIPINSQSENNSQHTAVPTENQQEKIQKTTEFTFL